MLSQGSQQEWGSFGSIAGDGLGKEWREMGHSVQWTSVYLIDAARRCSAVNQNVEGWNSSLLTRNLGYDMVFVICAIKQWSKQ